MKNHHVAASRRAAKSRRRLAQVRQQERLAGDRIPGPGENPTPEREASASSQAPLTAKHITYYGITQFIITPFDQAVLDAADEWYYDLLRRPTSQALRLLYDAVTARIPESTRTTS
jgi:hypothetical protein